MFGLWHAGMTEEEVAAVLDAEYDAMKEDPNHGSRARINDITVRNKVPLTFRQFIDHVLRPRRSALQVCGWF